MPGPDCVVREVAVWFGEVCGQAHPRGARPVGAPGAGWQLSPARVAARGSCTSAGLPSRPQAWTWPSPAYTHQAAFLRGRAGRGAPGPAPSQPVPQAGCGPGPIGQGPDLPAPEGQRRALAERAVELGGRLCPTRACAGSKKAPQCLGRGSSPSRGERRLRGPHGGRAGLYAEPYDPARPVSASTDLHPVASRCPPIPAQPGRPRREDYEYVRGGTRNLFLTCTAGWGVNEIRRGGWTPHQHG